MTNFNEHAQVLGYENEEEMVRELYLVKEMSSTLIGELLGTSYNTVLNLLKQYDIPTRTRGGANNTKRILDLIPDSELFKAPPGELAEKYNCTKATVYNEKRRRKARVTLPNRADLSAE